MELLNVGRQGNSRYKKLEHGLQHMRPKASLGHRDFSRWVLPVPMCIYSIRKEKDSAPTSMAEAVRPYDA